MIIFTETMAPYYLTLFKCAVIATAIWGSICYSLEYVY